MATPTGPTNRLYCRAFKKATTWGTAVAVGAGSGIRSVGDSGLNLAQKFEPYPAIDQILTKDGSLGLIDPIEFAPPIDLQYEMGAWGTALAMFFGTAGTPANLTGAYKHTFQWADFLTLFGTYVEERPGKIWEVPSAMPYKLNLKVSGSKISASLGFRGNKLIDTSAVNTATQVDAVTYAETGKFVNFIHGKYLMNTQSGAGLADPTDKVDASDFEISIERKIDGVHVLGSDNIAQPAEGEVPSFAFKLTLPRANATNMAFMTNFTGITTMKALLTFVGPLITGSNYYTWNLYFPRLVFAGPPDAKLEGVIKNVLTFEGQEAASAPTGMSYARPYAEIINTLATDYLA